MPGALILDFDGSVRPLPNSDRVSLEHRQEEIRFACRKATLQHLAVSLAPLLDQRPPVVFLGSGDFHHVTLALIERLGSLRQRMQILVFDNHPDNMLYPFGVHCGSWVWHVSRLPFVSRVHVAGITSSDVEPGHVWENRLEALRSGKVVYWCVQRDLSGLQKAGVSRSHSFPSTAAMLESLASALSSCSDPIYLSIDKDVLAHEVVQTNWDQGVMRLDELESMISFLRQRLIGSDVVGDVSHYRYRSWFKRLLSGRDDQPSVLMEQLAAWQERHRDVNLRLLDLLSSVDAAGRV